MMKQRPRPETPSKTHQSPPQPAESQVQRMDSRVLKYFLTIAQLGSITKAAEVLHVTQPTLSRQIKALEDELNATLLIRRHRDVVLTENGILFQQRASEILALFGKAEDDLQKGGEKLGGTVAIGMVESCVGEAMADVIAAFRKKHPQVRYHLYAANGDDIKEKLDWGRLDLGIVLDPVETAKYDYLRLPCRDIWGVLVDRDDPLAGMESVAASDLAKSPLILSSRDMVIDEAVKWLGAPRSQMNLVVTQNLLTNVLPLVSRGLGRVICIEGAWRLRESDRFRFVPFAPLRTSGHVMVWKKNKTFSRTTEAFLRHVEESFAAADAKVSGTQE